MSYQHKPVYFNDHRKPPPNAVVKIDKMEKMKTLARCCICFENYSPNTRAPICVPCGHSFCCICIRKLIYENIVCCCVCRNVSFFGPKELGKNIQLLDILDAMELLDPDTKTSSQPSSSLFPETVTEAVEDRDLVKFFEFCFRFLKKFYENKQENLISNLAMSGIITENGRQELEQQAALMHNARAGLGRSLDAALDRFNQCVQTMNSLNIDHIPDFFANYGDVMDDYNPGMEDDDFNSDDPFGIESVSINAFIALGPNPEQDIRDGFERIDTSTQSPMDEDLNFFNNQNSGNVHNSGNDYNPGRDYNAVNGHNYDSGNRRDYNAGNGRNYDSGNRRDYNVGNGHGYNSGYGHNYNSGNDEEIPYNRVDDDAPDDPHFQPGTWNPVSKLFDLPRIRNNNNRF